MQVCRSAVAALLAASVVAGCSSTGGPEGTTRSQPLVVADTGTPVQTVLAHLYADALSRGGAAARVDTVDGLPGALAGLDDASVALVPGFTGSFLAQLDPSSAARAPEDVYADLARALPEWLAVTDQGLAENGPTVSVTAAAGSALPEATLSALSPQCSRLSAAVDPAVDASAVTRALTESYDCAFAPAGPTEVTIVRATDRVAVVDATAVVLADDRDGLTADVLVPLVRKGSVDETLDRPLQIIAGELTTADLAEMVDRVRGGEDPGAVAASWLGTQSF